MLHLCKSTSRLSSSIWNQIRLRQSILLLYKIMLISVNLYMKRTKIKIQKQLCNYSKVPNNSAARLLILKIFSYQHSLIWTYTLIKIQIIFLLTRLLSAIFYFLSSFNAFYSLFSLQLLQQCIFVM